MGELPAGCGGSRHPTGNETKAGKTPQAATVSAGSDASAVQNDINPTSAGYGRASIVGSIAGGIPEDAFAGGSGSSSAGHGRATVVGTSVALNKYPGPNPRISKLATQSAGSRTPATGSAAKD